MILSVEPTTEHEDMGRKSRRKRHGSPKAGIRKLSANTGSRSGSKVADPGNQIHDPRTEEGSGKMQGQSACDGQPDVQTSRSEDARRTREEPADMGDSLRRRDVPAVVASCKELAKRHWKGIVGVALGLAVFYVGVARLAWATAQVKMSVIYAIVSGVVALAIALLKIVRDLVETDFTKDGFPAEHPEIYAVIIVAYNVLLLASALAAVLVLFMKVE